MDPWIVKFLNNGVGSFKILDEFMKLMMSDYLVPVTCSLVMLGLWFHGPKHIHRELNQLTVCIAAGGIGTVNLLIAILNAIYFRPRPFEVMELNLLFYYPTDSSFPSNFAGVGFAVATAVFLRHKKLGMFLGLITLVGAGGRVYAGVHYPSDIFAGAIVGATASLFAYFVSKKIAVILQIFLKLARKIHFA